MVRDDFAIFILSHGRANNLMTVKTLRKFNYSGRWYVVIDTDDDQQEQYIQNFGKEHILIFNKDDVENEFDIMDNFSGRQVPVYARNMLFKFAKQLGLTYFWELEDDYTNIRMRKVDENGVLRSHYFKNVDDAINPMLEFLDLSDAITVCWAQTGDLIGGKDACLYKEIISRKAMQTFFCRTDRPFQYFGRFNDDVNMYVYYGMIGKLVMSIRNVCIDQPVTQVTEGGIKDMYAKYGTYVKSFYSVMMCPSSVKIHIIGDKHYRIHHVVKHETSYVKVISSRYKKES